MAAAFTVTYERDESGWWVASVPAVQGCHTQGRTIEEARRRIREALGLFVSHADRATLVDEVHLPDSVQTKVNLYKTCKARLERDQSEFSVVARSTARTLSKELSLSVRDAGELLNLSGARVQQLLKSNSSAVTASARAGRRSARSPAVGTRKAK